MVNDPMRLPTGPIDDHPEPVPHRVYRYRKGGTSRSGTMRADVIGGASHSGRLAAKCLCGWEGVGEEEVQAHEALAQ